MKHQSIIEKLTLEEKAKLCSGKDYWHFNGVERLGIEPIMVTDGPHGLRKQDPNGKKKGLSNSIPATCFPQQQLLPAHGIPTLSTKWVRLSVMSAERKKFLFF